MRTRSMEESMQIYKPRRTRKSTNTSPQKQQPQQQQAQKQQQQQQHAHSNGISTPGNMKRSSSNGEPQPQQQFQQTGSSSLTPEEEEEEPPELLSVLGSYAEVDFAPLPDDQDVGDLLATTGDGLGDIDVKAKMAARLVLEGKSIASALGEFKDSQGEPLDALGVAKSTFNVAEAQIYNLWERGCKPPHVDWIQDAKQQAATGEKRKALPSGSQRQPDNGQRRRTDGGATPVKVAPRIAALGIHTDILTHALAEVYGRPAASVEAGDLHSFASSYPNVLPLITARARFISIRDGALIDTGIRNARHLAEHDAARRVADRLDEQLRSVMSRARAHAALVAANIEVIRERARALAPGSISQLVAPLPQHSHAATANGQAMAHDTMMDEGEDDISIYDSQTQAGMFSSQMPDFRPCVPPRPSQQRSFLFPPTRSSRLAASQQRSEYFTPPEAQAQSTSQAMREMQSTSQQQRVQSRHFAQAGPSSTPVKTAGSDRTLGASEVEAEREREREREHEQEAKRADVEVESQMVTAEELQAADEIERQYSSRLTAEVSTPDDQEHEQEQEPEHEHEEEQRMPSEHRSSSEQRHEHWHGDDHGAEGSQASDDEKQPGSSVYGDAAEEERRAQDDQEPSLRDLLEPVRQEKQPTQQEKQKEQEHSVASRGEEHSNTRSDRTETIEGGASSIWPSEEEYRAAVAAGKAVSQFSTLPPLPPSPSSSVKQKPKSLLAIPKVPEPSSTSASQFDELNEDAPPTQTKPKAKKLSFATKPSTQKMPPPSQGQGAKSSGGGGDKEMSPPSSTAATRGGDSDASATLRDTASARTVTSSASAQLRDAVGAGKLTNLIAPRRPAVLSGSTEKQHSSMPSSSAASAHAQRSSPLGTHENRAYKPAANEAEPNVEDIGLQPAKATRNGNTNDGEGGGRGETHTAPSEAPFSFNEGSTRKSGAGGGRHGTQY